MVIDIKYRVNRKKAFEVFRLYRTLENVSNNLIGSLFSAASKP